MNQQEINNTIITNRVRPRRRVSKYKKNCFISKRVIEIAHSVQNYLSSKFNLDENCGKYYSQVIIQ